MISFAYGIDAKQLVGAPVWFDMEKFDLDASGEEREPQTISNGKA